MFESIRLLRILFLVPAVRARCWYPDGKTVAKQDVQCRSEGNSTCCGAGFACLSNNICQVTNFVVNPPNTPLIRGSCSDPTWSDENCPLFCENPTDDDNQQGGIGISQCPDTDLEYYCQDSAGNSSICGTDSDKLIAFRGVCWSSWAS